MFSASAVRQVRWSWLLGACYVVLIGTIVWSLFYARRRALAEMATPASVGEWQAWRDDVERQVEHPGPVQRRVPKSAEPPALVLMRDFFAVCIVGAVLFSTLLYWVMAWLLMGALRDNSKITSFGPELPPRHGELPPRHGEHREAVYPQRNTDGRR